MISNKYYYLVASLPYLKFEEPPSITREQFQSSCEKWLSASDLHVLTQTDINELQVKRGDPEIIRTYKTFNLNFREGLASVRRARIELKTTHFHEVLEERTPLLMETKIARIMWNFLEELEPDYHFDLNSLILYFLKLQILERLKLFDKEKGRVIFEQLCEVNYE